MLLPLHLRRYDSIQRSSKFPVLNVRAGRQTFISNMINGRVHSQLHLSAKLNSQSARVLKAEQCAIMGSLGFTSPTSAKYHRRKLRQHNQPHRQWQRHVRHSTSPAEAVASDTDIDGRIRASPSNPEAANGIAAHASGVSSPSEVDIRQLLSNPDIEGDPLQFLKVSEAYWKALRNAKHNPGKKGPTVITKSFRSIGSTDFDVCIAGGTLGIFLALALQLRGHAVCVIERREVAGRTQEWNISRSELGTLSELGILSEADLEAAIVTEWKSMRVGFKGQKDDLWVDDVLNIGVDPRVLIRKARQQFIGAGGQVMERTSFLSAETAIDGISIRVSEKGGTAIGATVGDTNRPSVLRPEDLRATDSNSATGSGSGNDSNSNGGGRASGFQFDNGAASSHANHSGNGSNPSGSNGIDSSSSKNSSSKNNRRKGKQRTVKARLLIDCMGHYSPIVKQIRGGAKPEAVVLVVGSCASGFPAAANQDGDLLYTFTDAKDDMQLFWEAFPAQGGTARTTYMFAYADAHPKRPSFEDLLKRYFELLPQYQGVPLEDLKLRRVLFGAFPCIADSPLQPKFDRVLQVGDASAAQSPLSFGGFGAMVKSVGRLTDGVSDSLTGDRLDRRSLSAVQPYMPSLSAAWLFQRAMALGIGSLSKDRPGGGSTRGIVPPDHVNRLMKCNFSVMRRLGEWVLHPFLQDTLQFLPLAVTMLGMSFRDPLVVMRVVSQVGAMTLLRWVQHYFALATYTVLHVTVGRLAASSDVWRLRRWAAAWAAGSGFGNDHSTAHGSSRGSRTTSTAASGV